MKRGLIIFALIALSLLPRKQVTAAAVRSVNKTHVDLVLKRGPDGCNWIIASGSNGSVAMALSPVQWNEKCKCK